MAVPAKNEAARLSATLAALARQTDLRGQPLGRGRWEALLLINNSTDDSLSVANHFQQLHSWLPLCIAECQLPAEHAHIGHVRRLLMDSAYRRLSFQPKAFSLIISTDADTEVAPDWIAQNLEEVRRGAEAVGGRISLQPRDLQDLDPQTRSIHLRNDRYHLLLSWLEDRCDPQAHDPWPRH